MFVHEVLIDLSTANIRATFEGLPEIESKSKHDFTKEFQFRKSK